MEYVEVPGGRALRRWVKGAPGRSYVLLADKLGVTTQSVYEWRHGISSPGDTNRLLIRAATGIEPSVWADAEERRSARKAARRLARLQGEGEAHPSNVPPRKRTRNPGRVSSVARSAARL